MAPAVAALAAFLGGWQGAPVLVEAIGDAARAASVVDGVVVDLDKLCRATDPLIDALGDARSKSHTLNVLANAADRVCAAASEGPGVATDAKLVGATLTAIAEARAEALGTSAAPDTSYVPAHRTIGR